MIRVISFLVFLVIIQYQMKAQISAPEWVAFAQLPDSRGFAGMYAGISSGRLLAMGGANFPGDMPWSGGKKKWYDTIFCFSEEKGWHKAGQTLPETSGYGVSVSYRNRLILVGGSTATGHLKRVLALEWKNDALVFESLPELPVSLANMGGTLLGSLIFITGGMETPESAASARAFVLDLENLNAGWKDVNMEGIPARIFPVAGVYQGKIYLMGGETTRINSKGVKSRAILLDNYALELRKEGESWKATWHALASMPRGASAGGTELPLLANNRFLIWGGVDAVTAHYKDAKSHPGIVRSVLLYDPEADAWEFTGEQTTIAAPVTLPVVKWKDLWLYISGEIKPGIRTPTVTGVR